MFFQYVLISIADLFAVRYLWDVCNEDKCCVVTHRAADILVVSPSLSTWLVYVRTYFVPITTLNQNKRSRLLFLGANNNGCHKCSAIFQGNRQA